MQREIVPVTARGLKGDIFVDMDEEYQRIDLEKLPKLKPVFRKDNGTITAANSSKLSDGASALLLASFSKAIDLGLKPLARIKGMPFDPPSPPHPSHDIGYADAECPPKEFPIAPSLAVPLALKRAGVSIQDISLWEINEAFSVVVLANQKILSLDPTRVNVTGGAVSLGHPIGSSGARILVTLTHLLQKGQLGVAAICNGGGGATAVVIEKLV